LTTGYASTSSGSRRRQRARCSILAVLQAADGNVEANLIGDLAFLVDAKLFLLLL
jgi:hypothetical protein